MPKTRLQISVLIFVLLYVQQLTAQGNYRLSIRCVDKDSAFVAVVLSVPESFSNRFSCVEYVNKLPALLQSKGYVTASLDSVKYDSSSAKVVLFAGEVYQWALLNTGQVSPQLLDAVGWREKQFVNKPIDFGAIKNWQEKICSYLENNGHPFAKVFLDSLKIEEGKVSADLKVDQGPVYHIDSIHVVGNVKVSNLFLQKYLDIPAKSLYNRERLLKVTKKVRELSYVEETKASDLSLLATGSTLNVYLKPKRSSQVNVLLGFLPNNNQLTSKKLLVTGEANIRLHNALGQGEVIGLNWQQLQVKSPRLNLLYQHPYFLNSSIGLDFAFDMFRKDSTYLNVNMQLGGQYVLSGTQSGKVFIQRFQTIVNTIDTASILLNHHLPDVADVSSVNLGVDYEYNNTDYRLNPRKGNVLHIITSAGTKRIKKNSQVVELKDPNNPGYDFSTLYDTVKLKTYQFRVRATAEKYFQLAKQSTIKTAINAGIFQSGNIFRNELFQIGGYKLLRGFDEESQYLSHFAIGTVEYHYLIGLNSYFYVLADGGWGRSDIEQTKIDYTYLGTGLGLAFETKAGIFNMAWAVGKRSDTDFNLRQSKIHFGFVSYF